MRVININIKICTYLLETPMMFGPIAGGLGLCLSGIALVRSCVLPGARYGFAGGDVRSKERHAKTAASLSTAARAFGWPALSLFVFVVGGGLAVLRCGSAIFYFLTECDTTITTAVLRA